MTTDRRRAGLDLLALLALLAVLVGLRLLESGPLAPPPLTEGGVALERWLEARGPAAAVFALLRDGLVVVTWYLLVTAVAAVALRIAGAARAATVLDAMSLPATRRLVQVAAGLSLAASAAGATSTLTAPAGPAGAIVGRVPDEDVVVMQALPDEEVVMRRLPDETVPGAPAPAPAPAPAFRTVLAGEHFWHVAEEVLAAAWGRPPRDRETALYWRQMVDANRSRLADPDNADLLFPGQVIELPTPPPVPG